MSFVRKIKKKDGRVYLAEVESTWVDGKVKQKHIRYVGKMVNGKTILSSSLSNVEIEDVKVHGPLLVLDHLASEIGLGEMLGEYGKEILSMVYAHCLNYKSLRQLKQWYSRTDLNMILGLEDLTEKRLVNALDSLEQTDSAVLQKEIFEKVRKKHKLKVTGVLYDVTNTYLYGKKCSMGHSGHDKEGVRGRPLIQVGLGVTRDEGIPMFHKTFDGNVYDARTLRDLVTDFKGYNVPGGLFVYDRGITSGPNLKEIKRLRWDTLCGLALRGNLKDTIRDMAHPESFIDIENRVKLRKNSFYVKTMSHEIEGISGKLAVCFNEQQRKDLRESRYDNLLNAQTLLKQGKSIKTGLSKYLTKRGEIIKEAVSESEALDGFSCIFSTRKRLSKQEMVRLYFDKDLVEKAFQSMKGIVNLQPIRFWLSDRVVAHVFVCYLAYLLLSLLQFKLRKIDMTAVQALRELESLYNVYLRDSKKGFKISRTVALKKPQEKILRAVSSRLLHKS